MTDRKLVYAFDIDGTLCKTENSDYLGAVPYTERIARVNRLFDEGHIIKIFTGRGSESGIKWKEYTRAQLSSWHLRYHELIIGKPRFDVIVDDLAINSEEFFSGH